MRRASPCDGGGVPGATEDRQAQLGDRDLHIKAEGEGGDDVGLALQAGKGARRRDEVIGIAHIPNGIEDPVLTRGEEGRPRRGGGGVLAV